MAKLLRRVAGKPPYWMEQHRRRRAVRERLTEAQKAGLARPPLITFPELPDPHALILHYAAHLGMEVTDRLDRPHSGAIYYANRTLHDPCEALADLSQRALNLRCLDISKSKVASEFSRAFGYDLALDPENGEGLAVEKPEQNAMHEGQVIDLPAIRRRGYSYSRLIDNVVGEGLVEDLRVSVIGRSISHVVVKRRPIGSRFGNENLDAHFVQDPSALLTDQEQSNLLDMFNGMRVEFGEADCLRDRGSGLLYVVDVNTTPWGPTAELSPRHKEHLIHCGATALASALGLPGTSA